MELISKLYEIKEHDISSYDFVHLIIEMMNQQGREYEKELIQLLESKEENRHPKEVLFAAYYALACYYKRYDKIDNLWKIIRKNDAFFSFAPLSLEIASWYYRRKGDLKKALELDKELMNKLDISFNAAPYISYASSVSRLLKIEQDRRFSNKGILNWSGKDAIFKDWEGAIEAIQKAMQEYARIRNGKKYGKHFAIYGRLLMFTPDLEERSIKEINNILDLAEKNIKLAMQYENEKEEDYFKRYEEDNHFLNECYLVRMQLMIHLNNKETTTKMEELSVSKEKLEKKFEKVQVQEIEIISIFSAIIAIILSNIQLTASFSFVQTQMLMVSVLCICIILVSAAILLTNEGKKKYLAIVTGMLAIMIFTFLTYVVIKQLPV